MRDGKIIKKALDHKLTSYFIFVFACLSVITAVKCVSTGRYQSDLYYRWQECAYTLRGINPIDVLKGLKPVITEIGPLKPAFAGTAPWAYLLGNVFNFGFLPYGAAKVIGAAMFPAVLIITSVFVFRYVDKKSTNKMLAVLGVLVLSGNSHWYSSCFWGNGGAICACLIVLMIILIDTKPYMAGVLLALATVKPQLAVVFYLSLLLQRRWKVFLTASLIVALSWLSAAAMTGTSALKMLSQTAAQGIDGYASGGYGFFKVFINHGITRQQSLVLSAALGAIIIAALSLLLLKDPKTKNNNFLYYSVPAVVSVFWFYKQPHEFLIIAVLALALILSLSEFKFKAIIKISALALPFLYYFDSAALTLAIAAINRHRRALVLMITAYEYAAYLAWLLLILLIYALYADNKFSRQVKKLCLTKNV